MLEKNFTLKANANDFSARYAAEHKEVNGFTEWDINVKVEEQSEKSIVVDIAARGTGLIVTVSACRIYEPMGIIPVCYGVPECHISGFTAATKHDLIYQIAEQMARYDCNFNDDDGDYDRECYSVDAISIGTVIDYLENVLKKELEEHMEYSFGMSR